MTRLTTEKSRFLSRYCHTIIILQGKEAGGLPISNFTLKIKKFVEKVKFCVISGNFCVSSITALIEIRISKPFCA